MGRLLLARRFKTGADRVIADLAEMRMV